MSWNNIPDNERISLWKTLRAEISSLPLQSQLNKISEFFRKLPYGSRSIDYYNPEDWPTPWEIIYKGSLCRSSISLLMFYTLSLLHTGDSLELHLIDDGDDEFLLFVVNNQFVLNYLLGEVSNYLDVKNEFTVKQIFTEAQIKKIT